MGVILTPHQNEAIEKIIRHKKDWEPFMLGGCAGTGKTTLLYALAEYYKDELIMLAPTGKACQVLSRKMPAGTLIKTVHSALYSVREISDEELEEARKIAEESGEDQDIVRYTYLLEAKNNLGIEFTYSPCPELFSRVVVIDESSMLGYKEFKALKQICKKLILVGDPFQLQPVKSAQVLPSNPSDFDAFLSEVHRAALESPITRLATEIRMGGFKGWEYWKNEGIGFSYGLPKEEYAIADQVITGQNSTRMKLNRWLREEKNQVFPVVGDKIIVKQNIRESVSKRYNKLILVNGDIGSVVGSHESQNKITLYFDYKEDGDTHHTIKVNDSLLRAAFELPESNKPKWGSIVVDFAYAITAHASQGSEWPYVIIFDDEMRKNDIQNRKHWMYTSITRAKEKVHIVKPRNK